MEKIKTTILTSDNNGTFNHTINCDTHKNRVFVMINTSDYDGDMGTITVIANMESPEEEYRGWGANELFKLQVGQVLQSDCYGDSAQVIRIA